MSQEFDPYYEWLGIPPKDRPPNHYRLLGIELFEANLDVIANAAEQRILLVRTFQLGRHSNESQRILNEIAVARIHLLNADKKAAYDDELRTRLTTPPTLLRPALADVVACPHCGRYVKPSVELAGQLVSCPFCSGQFQVPWGSEADWVAPAVSAERMPGQRPTHGRATRRRTTKSPVVELVKIVLGGIGGLAAAYFLLLFVFHIDMLGPSNPKPSRSRETARGSAVQNTGQAESETNSKPTPGEPVKSPTAAPDAAEADNIRDAAPVAVKQEKPDAKWPPVQFYGPHAAPLVPEPNQPASPAAVPADPAAGDHRPEPRETPARRLPPPARGLQDAIAARVTEQFHPEEAASPVAKTRLAKQLLDLADQSSDKQDERFVLLRTAAELSCDGCDVELMLQAVDGLAKEYDVPEPEVQGHMLKRFLADGEKPERVMAFLRNCDAVISRATAADKLDLAVELADLAGGLCDRPVGSSQFREEILQRQTRVRRIGERFKQHQAALARLAAAPDDADAHATAGRWLCLVKGNWDEGLPHLSQGSEPRLKKLAQQELSAANAAPDVLVALGDGWYEMVQSAEAEEQLPMLRRADDCYRRAAESSSGLAKAEIDGRRKEIGQRLACLAPEEVQPASPLDAAKPSSASAEDSESQDLQVLFERALAAGMSGNDFTRAERLLSRCNQLDPQHVPTLNNLALMSLRNRNYRRAVHLWETAAELAPEDAAVQHNLQCLLRLAHANRLSLDRSAISSMERLCGPAGRNDAPRGRSYDGWQFLPYGPGGSSDNYADYRCLHCGGTGSVPCTASGCNGGTVGVQRSDVVGRARNGMPIIKKYTVRQRCSRCYGRGVITCPTCGGSGRSSF